MKIELVKLYNYIFGDWADVEKHLPEHLTKEQKLHVAEKKRSEIKKYFDDLIPKENKQNFRYLLRILKVSQLETILYSDKAEQLSPDAGVIRFGLFKEKKKPIQFPGKQEIESKFDSLNKQYNFLESNAKTQESFFNLFLLCKVVGDFIENNTDAENSQAYLNAYKLMVYFPEVNTLSAIDEYLKRYNFYVNSTRPLCNALQYALPINNKGKPVRYLNEWRQIIKKAGPRAMRLFARAAGLDEYLLLPPKDIKEIYEVATQCYKNAQQYPELAELCVDCNLTESLFDKCLQIEQNRKKKDSLPDVQIDGKEVDFPGYFLIKLPFTDPRAYLLGHMTNCCQSIGGQAAGCVVSGVTKENNGFYVLLQANGHSEEKSDNAQPMVDGKINYQAFDIVGQGYAWLSQLGNLVFDSWENLTPHDDKIVAGLLKQFAEKVTHEPKFKITQVVIGTGGKTPVELKLKKAQKEEILEGMASKDSEQQCLIYANQSRIDELKKSLREVIEDNIYSQRAIKLAGIILEGNISEKYYELTKNALNSEPVRRLLEERGLDNLNKNIWWGLINLNQLGVINDSLYKLLVAIPNTAAEIFAKYDKVKIGLDILLQYDVPLLPYILVSFDNYLSMADDVAKKIVKAYQCLKANELDDSDVLRMVFSSFSHVENMVTTVLKIQERFKEEKMDFKQERDLFLAACGAGENFIEGYRKIKQLFLESDPEIYRCILEFPHWACSLANALQLIKQHNLESYHLLRQFIINTPQYAGIVTRAVVSLCNAGVIVKDEHIQKIIENPFVAQETVDQIIAAGQLARPNL